jgi:hypothetical protein
MTREQYSRRQKILQNRLMRKHLSGIYNALQTTSYYFADIVRVHGIEAALMELNNHFHINEDIGPAVMELYKDAAEQAKPRLTISKSLIIPIIGFVKDVIQYLNQFLLDKVILPISRSMIEQIRVILKQAVSEGWGIEKTVSEIKNSEITKRRAKTIVRTESIRAMNYSQLKAADDANFEVEKQWIAIEDKRTRFMHTHAGVDGQVRDLYQPFSNDLQFPGDPEGSAAEVINCRCTLGYHYKRDLNDRLIRKAPKQELLPA